MKTKYLLIFTFCFSLITSLGCKSKSEKRAEEILKYQNLISQQIEEGNFENAYNTWKEADTKGYGREVIEYPDLVKEEIKYIILNNSGADAFKKMIFVMTDSGWMDRRFSKSDHCSYYWLSYAFELAQLSEDSELEELIRSKSYELFIKYTTGYLWIPEGTGAAWKSLLPKDFDVDSYIKEYNKNHKED